MTRSTPGVAAGGIVLALVLPALPGLAQTATDLPTRPAPQAPVSCAGKAAAYAGAGNVKLWVVRQGVAQEANPLRPLAKVELAIAQVVIGKRSTYVVGPDFTQLRRITGLRELESDEPVRWSSPDQLPPPALRIVTDDGRVVFGRLGFAGCEDAPSAPAPVEPAPRAKPSDRPVRPKSEAPAPSKSRLPQGAIQDPNLKR